MKKVVLFFSLLLAVVRLVHAQTGIAGEVAGVVETLRKAMIDADSSLLDRLISPQLSYGHSSGKVEDKAAFIQSLTSGHSDFISMELLQQTIVVEGSTAIVRHLLHAQTNDGGKPGMVQLAILLVWTRDHGHWRLLARQAVKA